MAGSIAFDTYTQGPQGTNTTFEWSHNCSGINRLFVVCGHQTDTITGFTYGGVSMTLAKAQSSGGTAMGIWYLVNPAAGNNSVIGTSSSSQFIRFSSISYTGVNQVNPINTTAGNTASGTGITASLTSTINNCWAVSVILGSGTLSGFTKVPSTATLRGNIGGDGQVGLMDSSQSFETGAYSLGISGGGSTTWSTAGIVIRPLDIPAGSIAYFM